MTGKGNILGLIFANMHDSSVIDLTKSRTVGSILFGGRYRLIDFPLSNMEMVSELTTEQAKAIERYNTKNYNGTWIF